MNTSNILRLNFKDLGKALVLFVLVTVLQLVLDLLNSKGLSITTADLSQVFDLSIKAVGAYLLKNLFSDESGKFLGAV